MFVVTGTATVDIIVRGMPAAMGDGFRAANLVFCDKPVQMLVGGNGANSAFVWGRLGANAALCSSVGQDDLGRWLADKLMAEHINLDGLLRHPELATSSSTILLSGAERQAVLHHKGSTNALEIDAKQEQLYAQADVLLVTSFSLFPQMRAGGFAAALALTHQSGGITGVDIGPAIGEPVKTAEIAPLFPYIDYLIANAHELRVCTDAADWESAAAQLLAQGCRCVVIKQGDQGTSLRAPDLALDLPSFPIAANISVGAGDSFNAGFLYAVWAGRPLAEALRFGSAVAALVVSGQQGVHSAPTIAEVEAFLSAV